MKITAFLILLTSALASAHPIVRPRLRASRVLGTEGADETVSSTVANDDGGDHGNTTRAFLKSNAVPLIAVTGGVAFLAAAVHWFARSRKAEEISPRDDGNGGTIAVPASSFLILERANVAEVA